MSRVSFEEKLNRYIKGKCSPQELKEIDIWFDLIDNKSSLPKSQEEWQFLKNELWQELSRKTIAKKSFKPIHFRKMIWLAASIIVFLGIYFIEFQKTSRIIDDSSMTKDFVYKVNNGSKFLALDLPDGSKIQLAPESNIYYKRNFEGDKRELFLDGKAFFDVAKNPNKPFLVYSKNIVAKVLGTSFWIEPKKNLSTILVKVISGKVSVYENQKKNSRSEDTKRTNGVIITPNQMVEYIETKKVFMTGIVENPILIKDKGFGNLTFDDQRIESILNTLEEYYGINIEVETENLLNCTLTADLNAVPFYTALEIICQSINAKYELKGTSVLLFGKGCQ